MLESRPELYLGAEVVAMSDFLNPFTLLSLQQPMGCKANVNTFIP